MNKELTALNMFAGPGTGKSTNAAGLFYKMKSDHLKVELITEYAKDKVYDGHFGCLEDQIYIFGQQQRKQKRLVGHVDYVITDSPLLLSSLYNKDLSETFDKLVLETFHSYNNLNFFIERAKPYFKIGRTQEEHEARELDKKLRVMLDKYRIPYNVIKGDEHCVDEIFSLVKLYHESRNR